MKKIIRISFVFLLLAFSTSSFVQAAFNLPRYVYKVNQLNTAQKHAKSSNKPIAFIYSDKNTDCGLATSASKDLFQGLKNYCVVVYVEHKDWNKLPNIVRSGINSPESGKYIPKTIVVTSSLKGVICIIPYAERSQRTQLIKQAQNLISTY